MAKKVAATELVGSIDERSPVRAEADGPFGERLNGLERPAGQLRPRTHAETLWPPLDRADIAAECLNVESRARTSLFPWNGQFSPQFVEAILEKYALPGSRILDPFCGSGTVISEASLLGISATGIELNPAAYILARIYLFANKSPVDRQKLSLSLELKLRKVMPEGWPMPTTGDVGSSETYQAALLILLAKVSSQERVVLEALIVLADLFEGVSSEKLAKTWTRLRRTIERLPYSQASLALYQGDGRYAKADRAYDLVLTSPPYINVYNYHQQYRASAEALGWDLLHVAKTEIGSNRKNRGNRFLTVTQYCLDLTICLNSLWCATTDDARIIFVMGRESRVRGVPFFNGRIAAALAVEAAGYRVVLRQERVFTNRFGQRIFEDILHFQKSRTPGVGALDTARRIAASVLRDGLVHANKPDVRADLLKAIEQAITTSPSPQYTSTLTASREEQHVPSNPAPRETSRYTRERQTTG